MFKFFENNVRFRSTHKQTRSFKQSLINQVLETHEIICIQKIYKKNIMQFLQNMMLSIFIFSIFTSLVKKIKIKDNFLL